MKHITSHPLVVGAIGETTLLATQAVEHIPSLDTIQAGVQLIIQIGIGIATLVQLFRKKKEQKNG